MRIIILNNFIYFIIYIITLFYGKITVIFKIFNYVISALCLYFFAKAQKYKQRAGLRIYNEINYFCNPQRLKQR